LILIVLAVLCTPAFGQTTASEWLDKGNALAGQGKYDEAIQAFDKAIEINPQYADAWSGKGTALRQIGRATEAMEAEAAYEKIVDAPGYTRPLTAIDWVNKGEYLEADGKWDEAIQAYDKAIQTDPQEEIAWNVKANLLKKLGRTTEANEAYAKVNKVEAARTITIIDHSMASNVDESTKSVIKRTHDFSVNDSKAYSWLSLKNVPGASTVWWYWFSPAGDMLYQDKAQIPQPTNGDRWSTYNILSHIDIAGNYPANFPGDWHVDVHLDGKILTEYFSVSGGQPPIAPENQYLYNPSKSDEATHENLYNQGKPDEVAYTKLYNQGKKNEAISKGDQLNAEGRYDEAIHFYDEAINLDPNKVENWQIWNSKGDALSKQGKYAKAIQAYDKAIELIPNNPMVWGRKGAALKALGRTNESGVAYATARELGDYSAWIPKTNATGINLTTLYHIEILDQSMTSNVDESTKNVTTRTNTFSSTDSKVYSWLSLGHVLGATVYWHWYSPDGNPYKTDQFDIPGNPSGGYWSSYNVWDHLDIANIPTEPYMSGNWHVDIYIGKQKRLTEQFTLKIGSGKTEISPNAKPGPSATHGTVKVLDHCMASEIDDATNLPVTTTKTHEFKDYMTANSWLRLGNIGVARAEWDWHHEGVVDLDKKDTFNIPTNPSGGYWPSYNVWSPLYISSLVSDWKMDETEVAAACREAEKENRLCTRTNMFTDPYGDWTVDVYVNDQWLLQEQFTVA
jgi:tetratricopeptide (TPR) repeat protein